MPAPTAEEAFRNVEQHAATAAAAVKDGDLELADFEASQVHSWMEHARGGLSELNADERFG